MEKNSSMQKIPTPTGTTSSSFHQVQPMAIDTGSGSQAGDFPYNAASTSPVAFSLPSVPNVQMLNQASEFEVGDIETQSAIADDDSF